MSVNHYLLPITDAELRSLKDDPESCPDFVNAHLDRVRSLFTAGCAITAIIAEDDRDELAFLRVGAPDSESGWIGEYVEDGGSVETCQVDMGYGPASYYVHHFVVKVAAKLRDIPESTFTGWYDADWLEDNYVYPTGWHDDGREDFTLSCFTTFRDCVLDAADNGYHLLVWCA